MLNIYEKDREKAKIWTSKNKFERACKIQKKIIAQELDVGKQYMQLV
jgi:ATP-dependent helicase/DNAse subunit B